MGIATAERPWSGHGPVPPDGLSVPVAPAPVGELDGFDDFGDGRNWISFDPQKGKMVCKNLGDQEFDEFTCVILESRVVRQMKDADGNVTCASADRTVADRGREGRLCESCEDRDAGCGKRWWIAWQEEGSGMIFAHTLSQTGSINFHRYANKLLRDGVHPSHVITRIFIEDARRQKVNTGYRRIQFDRVDDPFADQAGQ
ncbi:MAG: hypothetical protein KGL39_55655 [Patescibacteria group bacterium]|nr:hypothetical protein [Patescibacteria group bacterium]